MLYSKPRNVTYTEMAIAIDRMAYSEDCDDELLYQYLYLLSYMLAVKSRYFNSASLYDDFAVFVANSAFLRLKNKKQFILDENGEPRLKRIKSILNYLKTILYPKKVDFEQENYSQTDVQIEDIKDDIFSGYTFANQLSEAAESLMKVDFQCCLDSIAAAFRFYLKDIPYKYKSAEWYNIYTSCLLTFLNSITLSKKDIHNLINDPHKKQYFEVLENLYRKQDEDIILYHLDNSMEDYIRILVRRIKSNISKELTDILDIDISSYSMNPFIIHSEINSSYQNSGD